MNISRLQAPFSDAGLEHRTPTSNELWSARCFPRLLRAAHDRPADRRALAELIGRSRHLGARPIKAPRHRSSLAVPFQSTPFKGGGTWNAGTDRRKGGPCHLERTLERERGTRRKPWIFGRNNVRAAKAPASTGTLPGTRRKMGFKTCLKIRSDPERTSRTCRLTRYNASPR